MQLACASLLAASLMLPATKPALNDLFPAPQTPVTIGSAEGMSYAELVQSFCESTGLELVPDPGVLQRLEATSVEILAPITVDPAQVYPVVETFFATQGFVLQPIGRGPIFRLRDARRGPLADLGLYIDAADLGTVAAHPALVAWSVLHTDPLEARHLTNSLRGLINDTNTQSAIAVGDSNSLILRGSGGFLADMAAALAVVQDEAARFREAQEAARKAVEVDKSHEQREPEDAAGEDGEGKNGEGAR